MMTLLAATCCSHVALERSVMVLTLCSYLLLRLVFVPPLAPYVAAFPDRVLAALRLTSSSAVSSRPSLLLYRPLLLCLPDRRLFFIGLASSFFQSRLVALHSFRSPNAPTCPAAGQCLRLFLLTVKIFTQFSSITSNHLSL